MAKNDPTDLPYGYEDPNAEYSSYAAGRRKEWGDVAAQAGGSGYMPDEQLYSQPDYFLGEFLKKKGWTRDQYDAARDAWAARQSAIGLDGGRGQAIGQARQAFEQNRAAQAGLIGAMADRARLGGTSASQWASRAGMNELSNEVAAQAAADPRVAMRAMAAGGGELAQQAAKQQAAEGLGTQQALQRQVAGVRGADLQQGQRELQLHQDELAWQQAKERAGQRWADLALQSRGIDVGTEIALMRALADAEGGVNWQNLGAGVLGAAGTGLAMYGSMNSGPSQQDLANYQNAAGWSGYGAGAAAATPPGVIGASPMGAAAVGGAEQVFKKYGL
jgi:hypothetical protein